MNQTADAIVVGAGIIGTSIAAQLAARGHDVVVVDKGAGAGFGSTSASSAIIRFNYSVLESAVTAWEAADLWRGLRDYLQAPRDEALACFHRNGMVMLDVDTFPRARSVGFFQQIGIDYEEWGPDDLARALPGIDSGRFYPPRPLDDDDFFNEPDGELGALFTPQAGFVDDPRLACQNFMDAAVRRGARTLFRRRVVETTQLPGDNWKLRLDDGTTLSAPVVVNAAGPWSGALNALAGVGAEFRVTTRPLRQEVHAVPAPAGFNPQGGIGPSIADQDLGYYLRPEPSGSLVIGGTEPACDPLDWVTDPDAINPLRTAELFDTQVTRAARRFPSMRIPPRPTGVVGVYDVTTDWTPIYDRTDAAGWFVAMGTSGNQFKNGPIVGEFMAALIEAVAAGVDHDAHPVHHRGAVSGLTVDLGVFSRLREPAMNSGSVAG